MQKLVQNIVIVCLSVLIFFTGIGLTVFHFCCDNCVENIFTQESCDINHKDNSSSCCEQESRTHCQNTHNKETSECCTTDRYSIDLDFVHSHFVFTTPFVWINSTYLQLKKILPDELEVCQFVEQHKAPPNMHPRAYLSLIRILII